MNTCLQAAEEGSGVSTDEKDSFGDKNDSSSSVTKPTLETRQKVKKNKAADEVHKEEKETVQTKEGVDAEQSDLPFYEHFVELPEVIERDSQSNSDFKTQSSPKKHQDTVQEDQTEEDGLSNFGQVDEDQPGGNCDEDSRNLAVTQATTLSPYAQLMAEARKKSEELRAKGMFMVD